VESHDVLHDDGSLPISRPKMRWPGGKGG